MRFPVDHRYLKENKTPSICSIILHVDLHLAHVALTFNFVYRSLLCPILDSINSFATIIYSSLTLPHLFTLVFLSGCVLVFFRAS